MLFNTMQYFVFLPIVVFIYYILPQRVRYVWLLAASYYFYMQWNPLYIVLLFFSTCITYTGARVIGRLNAACAGEAKLLPENRGGGKGKTDLPFYLYCAEPWHIRVL